MPLKAGYTTPIPDLPGRWSVWSPSNETPGAHFFVPANDEARESGIKYLTVKVTFPRTSALPDLTVLSITKY